MEDSLSKFLSRNYHLALIGLISGVVALFTSYMHPGEFVTLTLGIVSSFRAGDVAVNWLNNREKKP